jgi:hypothetical protein
MRTLIIVALLAACGGGTKVDLDLTDNQNRCGAALVFGLTSMRVVAYGQNQGELCVLATQCVTLGNENTVEEIEQTLRAKQQPLVETDGDVGIVAVLGYREPLCAEPLRLCGFADAADGTVEVPVQCELLPINPACAAEPVPVCP